jgi:uncharacterized membrane protein YsdA (DUF1294 family)
MIWFILYLCLSLATMILFYFDKWAAQSNARRIPEVWLHSLEFAGGWPGALLGAHLFRHKRRKWAYMRWLYLSVCVHVAIWTLRITS